jgi:dUTP pyrophosphatase
MNKEETLKYAEDIKPNYVYVKLKKLHPQAQMPVYANLTDAGADLTAVSVTHVPATPEEAAYYEYGTGIAIKVPEGYAGFIYPRSSVSKKDLFLANAVGVVDSGYVGEIKLRFKYKTNPKIYNIGDKIGQLIVMPVPTIHFSEVSELPITDRGHGGFGSSGN